MSLTTPDVGLVGRERELAELVSWMEQAASGRGRMALLVGAPGIGKSRLAAELAEIARARHIVVLAGRCWADSGTRAYWPWVQILRAYLRTTSVEDLRRLAGADAAELARVMPEIGGTAGTPERDPEGGGDPNVARFRLFDAVATVLRNAAEQRPLLLVMEDLHAADTPSALLLRFLVSQLGDAPIFVVCTHRDLVLAPDLPNAAAIEQLTRDPNTIAVRLAGLSAADASRFVERTVGTRPDATLMAALWRETRGNPLFLAQAVQLLDAEGRLAGSDSVREIALAVPAEIMEVILRRAEHLGPDAVRVLSHAAVLGPEFGVDMLRRIVDLQPEQLLTLLTDAVRAGLAAEVAGAPGVYRFAHDLVRESLADVLPTPARMALHRRIVDTIEEVHAGELAQHAPVLAYHALEAARGRALNDAVGQSAPLAQRAIGYARQAGDQALRSSAFEEAARLYRTAISVADLHPPVDDAQRLQLSMSLGEAEGRANNLDVSREVFLEAVEAARRLGSPLDLARAALGYSGRLVWARAGGDARIVPLLQEALVMLGGADDHLRARLLVRLSCALRGQRGAREQSAALSQQAVDIARALGDDLTLTYVLGGRAWAIWWPDNIDERVAIAHEMLEAAIRGDDPERVVDAHTMLALSHLDLGEIDRARAEIAEIDRVAGHIRQPAQRWLGTGQRVNVELAVGNFAAAERLMEDEIEEGYPVSPGRDDVSAARMHRYHLARERGTLAEVEPLVRASAVEFPWYPLHRAALANLLLDLERTDEARAVIEALARDDFAIFEEDNEWLLGICLAAEAVARLGERAAAAVLYRQLLPRAGRHAVGHPEGSVGVTDRYLGLLAEALGKRELAIGHLDDAVRINARMGLRPWTVRAQADLADVLQRRAAPGDAERAAEIRERALNTARAVGMPVLERRLAAALGGGRPAAGVTAVRGPAAGVFRREGEYWTVAYEGVTSRLRDSRGLRHIARLLAVPEQEIHALDLARDAAAHNFPGRSAADGGEVDAGEGAGPLLDAEAKAAYRARLDELREERAEAERWDDTERVRRADAEMQAIAAQLSAAVGLGGRDRSAASNAERARISVTRAIKSAIDRIGSQNEPLQRHLAATIHTGTFCSYRPDPRVTADWEL